MRQKKRIARHWLAHFKMPSDQVRIATAAAIGTFHREVSDTRKLFDDALNRKQEITASRSANIVTPVLYRYEYEYDAVGNVRKETDFLADFPTTIVQPKHVACHCLETTGTADGFFESRGVFALGSNIHPNDSIQGPPTPCTGPWQPRHLWRMRQKSASRDTGSPIPRCLRIRLESRLLRLSLRFMEKSLYRCKFFA